VERKTQDPAGYHRKRKSAHRFSSERVAHYLRARSWGGGSNSWSSASLEQGKGGDPLTTLRRIKVGRKFTVARKETGDANADHSRMH